MAQTVHTFWRYWTHLVHSSPIIASEIHYRSSSLVSDRSVVAVVGSVRSELMVVAVVDTDNESDQGEKEGQSTEAEGDPSHVVRVSQALVTECLLEVVQYHCRGHQQHHD